MKALDLFCGAGGSAMGLHQAGFDVIGIDHNPELSYPFPRITADAMPILRHLAKDGIEALREYGLDPDGIDLIWASPPCQSFSAYRRKDPARVGAKAKDLIAEVRQLLIEIGLPYIIENVEAAPLKNAIRLCGSSFGLDVRRHRLFECSFAVEAPPCDHALHVSRGKRFPGATNRPAGRYTCEVGVYRIPLAIQREAMGIDWMTLSELSQAIPPAYSKYLAECFKRQPKRPEGQKRKAMTKKTKKSTKRNPLVISFGGGVDSTAMIIGYAEEGIVPDAIIFADVGAEHPETYHHVTETIPWLLGLLKFPPLITVRYKPKRPVNGMYETIEEQCLVNRTLPSAAFGMKKCSQKWKGGPLDAWVAENFADHIAAGGVVDRAIGYEANETRRGGGQGNEDTRFNWVYPLREWGWTREDCIKKIDEWSLPEVRKSACIFCPHSKPSEVRELAQDYPELAARAIAVEDAGLPYAKKVTGLWRRPCKGTRGAQKHPGNWREFLAGEDLLPADSLIRKFRTRLESKKPERPEDVEPAAQAELSPCEDVVQP